MLVSVTLAKNNELTIRRAIESAKNLGVNYKCVIDTGSTDGTKEVAKAHGADVLETDWPNNFATARNRAFELAYESMKNRGIENGSPVWAIMLDSDEEIFGNGRNDLRDCGSILHSNLASVEKHFNSCTHIACQNEDRTEWRERIFRLPLQGKFVGPTHEYFTPCENRGNTEAIRFYGKPKSEEQLKQKAKRDVELLKPYAAEHTEESRWYFYLGNSYTILGDGDKAIESYSAAMNTQNGWDEERAYSAFAIGRIQIEIGNLDGAIAYGLQALEIRPDMAEAAWLIGFAYSKKKDWNQTKLWGHITETIVREFEQNKRSGFRFSHNGLVVAETFGPVDLLRVAYGELGNDKMNRFYLERQQVFMPGFEQ